MTPRPNTYKHPLDMAVHPPEPMPEPWYERHAGWITLSAMLANMAVVGFALWGIHSALCS